MLKLGVAFLARFLLLAVVIEARNSEPGPISTGLTRLRIESSGKGVLLGKLGTVALEIIFVGAWRVHPETQAFIANELYNPDSFLNGSILLFCAIYLVLKDQHPVLLCLSMSCWMVPVGFSRCFPNIQNLPRKEQRR